MLLCMYVNGGVVYLVYTKAFVALPLYILLLLLGPAGLELLIFSSRGWNFLGLRLELDLNGSQKGHHLLDSICKVRIVICWAVIAHSSWGPWPDEGRNGVAMI